MNGDDEDGESGVWLVRGLHHNKEGKIARGDMLYVLIQERLRPQRMALLRRYATQLKARGIGEWQPWDFRYDNPISALLPTGRPAVSALPAARDWLLDQPEVAGVQVHQARGVPCPRPPPNHPSSVFSAFMLQLHDTDQSGQLRTVDYRESLVAGNAGATRSRWFSPQRIVTPNTRARLGLIYIPIIGLIYVIFK